MSGYTVAICVATFRRPEGLARCLSAISSMKTDASFQIVVADNDVDGGQGMATCREMLANGFSLPLKAIAVQERGIAQARNALVIEALKNEDIQFIAMIDDDEWPEEQWLQALLDAQTLTNADVVGGPVRRIFEKPVPSYVARANLADFSKIPNGVIDWVDGTSNVLFAASVFRGRPSPWFDPVFGLLGGEDTDMLLGLKLAGTRFGWACDAMVLEDMPTSRSSVRWMLKRAYRIGNTYTLVNRKRRPPGFGLVSEAIRVCGTISLIAAILLVFFWHPAKRFEAARLSARVLGKISALFGHKHVEYSVTHGS